jgi:hypothetical protein
MMHAEIRIRNATGKVVSEHMVELDVGTGRFEEIERAVEGLKRHVLPGVERDLLTRSQAEFVERIKKTELIG